MPPEQKPIPTLEQQIAAQAEYTARLSHKVDNLVAAGLAERAAARLDATPAARKDEAETTDQGQLLALLTQLLARLDTAPKTGDDEDEEGRADAPDPEGLGPANPMSRRTQASTEDRDHKDDTRADSNRIGEFQARADRVAMMHGASIAPPRLGDSYRTYLDRTLNQLCRHCLPNGHQLQNADLRLNRDDHQLESLKDRILADAEAAAYNPTHNTQPGQLREVRRQDRSGRWISEFVGDVAVTIAPFRAPVARLDVRALQDKCDRLEVAQAQADAMGQAMAEAQARMQAGAANDG